MPHHDKDLIDALRAWHQIEHGDHAGAMQTAAGREFPSEWADVFEAQRHAAECWGLVEEAAATRGYDSKTFVLAADLWSDAIAHLAATLKKAQQEPSAAQAARGGGPRRVAAPSPQRGGRRASAPLAGVPPQVAGMMAASLMPSMMAQHMGRTSSVTQNVSSSGGASHGGGGMPAAGAPFDLSGIAVNFGRP